VQTISTVRPGGLTHLTGSEITPTSVGQKATGLSTLPPGWTLPFFVVDAACEFEDVSATADQQVVARNRTSLQLALSELRLSANQLVIVRSSGTAETMEHRGSLVSEACRVDQVAATISGLKQQVRALPGYEHAIVHWIVQAKAEAKQTGHLSNERRLKAEWRDWVAQFDADKDSHGQVQDFAVRAWRDGPFVLVDRLGCGYAAHLLEALKTAAMWATSFKARIHFEWVWDGDHVFLVQADKCEDRPGVKPTALVATKLAKPRVDALKAFRLERKQDLRNYGKLGNAALYRKLGYDMPAFHVLDQAETVQAILAGHFDSQLISDLDQLTTRPLVIRTDGTNIPEEKREMLPRSDELRSTDAALKWLKDSFAPKITAAGLSNAGLCLLAHHYVPAVASAWAHAEPGKRMVRIESLWGIPEGLYWYSHDTFEVDTGEIDASKLSITETRSLDIKPRHRYKGTFVAPDEHGHWIMQQTAVPFDWSRSIRRQEWIEEIAVASRHIAAAGKKAVNVMWLVDVVPAASKHKVLPWFHSTSSLTGGARAAPTRKISWHKDFAIRTSPDWGKLKDELARGTKIDRVTVEPQDAALIRNADFAKDLAECAKQSGFVVELSGGILSHAYYVLTRAGCSVECVDLFGATEDVLEFNKIVRDQIPAQITDRGEKAEVIRLKGDALIQALKQKLVEEAVEVLDSRSSDDLVAELADVSEVIKTICDELSIDASAIETERLRKKKKRGGFERGLMLVRTANPHTLSTQTDKDLSIGQELVGAPVGEVDQRSISTSLSRENRRLSMKPDLRALSRAFEKLVTFETEFSTLVERRGSAKFDLPLDGHSNSEFKLEVELRRVKSRLRAAIKLVSAPLQFSLPLVEKK